MDTEQRRRALEGCYVTVPTPFADREGWPIDDAALRTYVRFLVDHGLRGDRATLLAGGAAGDFSTMTFDERVHVASVVVEEAGGRVPVAMGAQTTSMLELVRLARAAQSLGADFIQVSCPFYFEHGEDDFEEFVREAAAAAPEIGIIVYNTFWTSSGLSFAMVERLAAIANVVGLKWATPRTDAMEFEDVTSRFSDRFTIIDNNLFFAFSAMPALGARAFEVHLCNFWPEWGIKLLDEVRARSYHEIARTTMNSPAHPAQAVGAAALTQRGPIRRACAATRAPTDGSGSTTTSSSRTWSSAPTMSRGASSIPTPTGACSRSPRRRRCDRDVRGDVELIGCEEHMAARAVDAARAAELRDAVRKAAARPEDLGDRQHSL